MALKFFREGKGIERDLVSIFIAMLQLETKKCTLGQIFVVFVV